MGNDIIEIKDRFIVDDSHSRIRGFVSAYDDQGNKIFLKENMIVEKGRELILKSLKGELSKLSDSLFYSEDKTIGNETVKVASNLTGFISSDSRVTRPTMELGNNNTGDSVNITSGTHLIERIVLDEERSGNDGKRICFELSVPAGSGGQLNRWCSLGLIYTVKDPSTNTLTNTLFSRVTFPPYSQTANVKVYYYIYF